MEFFFTLGGYVKMHGDADESSTKQSKDNIDLKNLFIINNWSKICNLICRSSCKFIFSIILLVFINCFFGFTSTKPIISEIEKGMPADLSGLKVGDTVLEINEKISDFSDLRAILSSNETIRLTYSRNNNIEIINLKTVKGKIELKVQLKQENLTF